VEADSLAVPQPQGRGVLLATAWSDEIDAARAPTEAGVAEPMGSARGLDPSRRRTVEFPRCGRCLAWRHRVRPLEPAARAAAGEEERDEAEDGESHPPHIRQITTSRHTRARSHGSGEMTCASGSDAERPAASVPHRPAVAPDLAVADADRESARPRDQSRTTEPRAFAAFDYSNLVQSGPLHISPAGQAQEDRATSDEQNERQQNVERSD
jgi:hypothetical protein